MPSDLDVLLELADVVADVGPIRGGELLLEELAVLLRPGVDECPEEGDYLDGAVAEIGALEDYFVSGAGDCNTTCAPFEPVRCDVFVTESTFGLPIYRWAPQTEVLGEMRAWWADCAAQGKHEIGRAHV